MADFGPMIAACAQPGCHWMNWSASEARERQQQAFSHGVSFATAAGVEEWQASEQVLVPAHAGLLSNLRLWENIILPLWYHQRQLPDELEATLCQWLTQFGLGDKTAEQWLHQTVGMSHLADRKLAALLRALLAPARCLWLEAGWAEDLEPARLARWVAVLQPLAVNLGKCVWIVGEPEQAGSPWQPVLKGLLPETGLKEEKLT